MHSLEEIKDFLKFEEFYNKATGEKVRVTRGYNIIESYLENTKCSIFGRAIKKESHPIADRGSYYYIDFTGVVVGKDYVVINDKNDIEILGVEEFEKLYSKYKINKTEFLKIETEKEVFFLRFDSIRFIAFSKEKREPITIIHSKGREVLDCNSVLNFDEMEEALKNYVEKEIA